jgi:hypothetical protein
LCDGIRRENFLVFKKNKVELEYGYLEMFMIEACKARIRATLDLWSLIKNKKRTTIIHKVQDGGVKGGLSS